MTKEDILREFQSSGALLEGHFKLRSGLHSNRFFQAALLLQYPDAAGRLCAALAGEFAGQKVDAVISPAVGGLIVGHELARALGCRAIFADKEDGELVLKRGFKINPGDRIVIGEDVITRGGRVRQTLDLALGFGAEVLGIGVIVDRSGGEAVFSVPHHSLTRLELETYEPDSCPLCAAGIPLDRPGSK